VFVFTDASQVKEPYEVVGIVSYDSPGKYRVLSLGDAIEPLKHSNKGQGDWSERHNHRQVATHKVWNYIHRHLCRSSSNTAQEPKLISAPSGSVIIGDPTSSFERGRKVIRNGFFLRRLGRERVGVVYESGVELPSDLSGILYVQYDSGKSWMYAVAEVMNAAGYEVDLNAV
jgi:Predicted nucleotide-binding protein containing TIR-like domain